MNQSRAVWAVAISLIKGEKWKTVGDADLPAEELLQSSALADFRKALTERDSRVQAEARLSEATNWHRFDKEHDDDSWCCQREKELRDEVTALAQEPATAPAQAKLHECRKDENGCTWECIGVPKRPATAVEGPVCRVLPPQPRPDIAPDFDKSACGTSQPETEQVRARQLKKCVGKVNALLSAAKPAEPNPGDYCDHGLPKDSRLCVHCEARREADIRNAALEEAAIQFENSSRWISPIGIPNITMAIRAIKSALASASEPTRRDE